MPNGPVGQLMLPFRHGNPQFAVRQPLTQLIMAITQIGNGDFSEDHDQTFNFAHRTVKALGTDLAPPERMAWIRTMMHPLQIGYAPTHDYLRLLLEFSRSVPLDLVLDEQPPLDLVQGLQAGGQFAEMVLRIVGQDDLFAIDVSSLDSPSPAAYAVPTASCESLDSLVDATIPPHPYTSAAQRLCRNHREVVEEIVKYYLLTDTLEHVAMARMALVRIACYGGPEGARRIFRDKDIYSIFFKASSPSYTAFESRKSIRETALSRLGPFLSDLLAKGCYKLIVKSQKPEVEAAFGLPPEHGLAQWVLCHAPDVEDVLMQCHVTETMAECLEAFQNKAYSTSVSPIFQVFVDCGLHARAVQRFCRAGSLTGTDELLYESAAKYVRSFLLTHPRYVMKSPEVQKPIISFLRRTFTGFDGEPNRTQYTALPVLAALPRQLILETPQLLTDVFVPVVRTGTDRGASGPTYECLLTILHGPGAKNQTVEQGENPQRLDLEVERAAAQELLAKYAAAHPNHFLTAAINAGNAHSTQTCIGAFNYLRAILSAEYPEADFALLKGANIRDPQGWIRLLHLPTSGPYSIWGAGQISGGEREAVHMARWMLGFELVQQFKRKEVFEKLKAGVAGDTTEQGWTAEALVTRLKTRLNESVPASLQKRYPKFDLKTPMPV